MSERFVQYSLKTSLKIDNVYTAFINTILNNYTSDGEFHDFYELVYVDNGEVLAEVEAFPKNKIIKIKQGECYLHGNNRYHRHFVEDKMVSSICIVSFECKNLLLKSIEEKIITLSELQQFYLTTLMRYASEVFSRIDCSTEGIQLLKHEKYSPILEQLFTNNLENLFLDIALKDLPKSKQLHSKLYSKDPLVLEIEGYLQENLYSKISVEDICAHVSYGKTTISKRFKNATGMSVMHYYNILKLKEAVKLIDLDKGNLMEISNQLNFSNYPHFSKIFKNYFGIYPREYKNSIIANKNVKLLNQYKYNNKLNSIFFI